MFINKVAPGGPALARRIDLQGVAAGALGLARGRSSGAWHGRPPFRRRSAAQAQICLGVLASRLQGGLSAARCKTVAQSRSLTTIGRILFTPRSSRAAAPD